MAGPPEEMRHFGVLELQAKEGGKIVVGRMAPQRPDRGKDSRAVVLEGSASFLSSRRSLCRSVLSILCFPHDRQRKGTLAIFHVALIKYLPKATY